MKDIGQNCTMQYNNTAIPTLYNKKSVYPIKSEIQYENRYSEIK